MESVNDLSNNSVSCFVVDKTLQPFSCVLKEMYGKIFVKHSNKR